MAPNYVVCFPSRKSYMNCVVGRKPSLSEKMEGESSSLQIHRTSSIENEPRTLSIDQIQYAREAAMYVVNTRSIEEAMNIFTQGLEPVVEVARDKMETATIEGIEYLQDIGLQGMRDVVSAPF
ncbi:hypothetical protein GOBAR_AA35893 [Gossypium barbadense]|uniref:Uncharacterized protein n=1 Tax=Gossypium barbadense TaxID=3634 RepID=A0A2P5W139_GOSBA|nr:hypothetical protein GOBAR_AA35893 [Gossypium barbadense]